MTVARALTSLQPLTLPLRGRRLIEASAGTGKTWTLAALYLRLVLGHGRGADGQPGPGLLPPQILVMTFTEAATAELRERIRFRLAQAADFFAERLRPEELELNDSFLPDLRDSFEAQAWPACSLQLSLAAQWMDNAAIFTLHGWSHRMLREHAFDSQSLFEQTHVEDRESLLRQAVQDYWRTWLYPLPADQLQALSSQTGQTPDGLLQVLRPGLRALERSPEVSTDNASAGIADIFQQWQDWSVKSEDLLAQIRAGWSEEVVAAILAAKEANLLRNTRLDYLENWLSEVSLWVQGSAEKLRLETLHRFKLSSLQKLGWQGASAWPVFSLFDDWADHAALQPDVVTSFHAHALHWVHQAFVQAKQQRAQFDFHDLLERLYRAVQSDDGRMAHAIRTQYPVAMVDEFQDTDPWQYGTLKRIYLGQPDAMLIMIGDPKQAIYGFRGADLATYLKAREDTQAEDPEALHTLLDNYRSTPALVRAVNAVFSHRPAAWGDLHFQPAKASKAESAPLQVQGKTLAPLSFAVIHNAVQNARPDPMAERIVAVLGVAAPGDVAVLVRDWVQARAVREALAARGVASVYLSERGSVFKTEEAQDLWLLLKALAEPRRAEPLRTAVATRLWGLDDASLGWTLQDEAAWDALQDRCQSWHQIWQRQGVLPLLRHWLHDTLAGQRLLASEGGERRLSNLLHLGELLHQASQTLQGTSALVRHLGEQIQSEVDTPEAAQLRLETDAQRVQIVSFHKSKGLEYPFVFVPYLSAFKPPDDKEQVDISEDVRLIYVALTRAKQGLWLGLNTSAKEFNKAGQGSAWCQLLGRQGPDDLMACLQSLQQVCTDIAIEVIDAQQIPLTRMPAPPADPAPRKALQTRLPHWPFWWTASFSALTRNLGQVEVAEDASDLPQSDSDERRADDQHDHRSIEAWAPAEESNSSPSAWQDFPAGATYGTALHELLEWQAGQGWPRAKPPASLPAALQKAWSGLLQRKQKALALNATQVQQLDEWVAQTLTTPLPLTEVSSEPALSLRLCDLPTASLFCEMPFTLPIQSMRCAALDALIQAHLWPGRERPALNARDLHGMLTGFMDLVFEHAGRYWVLDYKSNRLPGYSRAPLEAALLHKRYDVQSVLYTLALHRLLRYRVPGYHYEQHMGGAVYLFMRGLGQPGAGVHAHRPPWALIDALDQGFREGDA
jgi:exodeoxyribonuclease V beta subunit